MLQRPMDGLWLADWMAERRARLPWYKRHDADMTMVKLVLMSALFALAFPFGETLLIAAIGVQFLLTIMAVIGGFLLLMGALWTIRSFRQSRHHSDSFPFEASQASTWFSINPRLLGDLSLAGVSGGELGSALYLEAERRWSRLLRVVVLFLATAALVLGVATYAYHPEVGLLPLLCYSILPITIAVSARLVVHCAAIIDLDTRYYAWLKMMDYGRYTRLSIFVGGIATGITALLGLLLLERLHSSTVRWGMHLLGIVEMNFEPAFHLYLYGILGLALGAALVAVACFASWRLRTRISVMEKEFPRLMERIGEEERH
jgi:hypothetical protein